jgi:hypothetical protein
LAEADAAKSDGSADTELLRRSPLTGSRPLQLPLPTLRRIRTRVEAIVAAAALPARFEI